MKYLDYLNKAVTVFTGLMLGFMTVLVLLQIFYRYVLVSPFPQGQELAVYAMVYVVMFGSTIAVHNKSHIAVTFIVDRFPAPMKFTLRMVAYAAMIVFFALIIYHGWGLMMRAMRQMSPTTGIPVGYIVASLPISSGISIIYILQLMWNELTAFRLSGQPGHDQY